jgi:hypothetical protein
MHGIPSWVRYVVDTITCADAPWSAMGSVVQGFGSRVDAERFARAMSKRIPNLLTAGGCSSQWITVGAIHKSNASPNLYDRARVHWYRTLDHGGTVVKDHPIDPWYHGGKLPTAPGVSP